jgi:serine/threonine protein kinase
LLNKDGHIKLADFGMSRFLKNDDKSYTLCGTPEYVAPEIILKQGHNFCVDWYSLVIKVIFIIIGNFDLRNANWGSTILLRG